eukprot:6462983-Amphidinium_carterae.1
MDDDISSDSAGADSDSVQTETTAVDLDSLLETIEATANSEDCPSTMGTEVTVGSVTSTVYATEDLTSGTSVAANCSSVNIGYEGNLSLRCSYGTLTAISYCSALGCTDSIDVTLGDATTAITPNAEIFSGLSETFSCNNVTSTYSGTFTLKCYEGNLTADTSNCLASCLTTHEVNLTVAGSSTLWSPSADMTSGTTDSTTDCSSINADYEGVVSVRCFNGALIEDLAGCSPKGCEDGTSVSVALGGTTTDVALASAMASGTTGSMACRSANSLYSQDVFLSCLKGRVSYSVSSCRLDCPTSTGVSTTLGDETATVNPSSDMTHGDTETLIACSGVNSGYQGTFSMTCDNGTLTPDTSSCVELDCVADEYEVNILGYIGNLTIDETVESGGTTDAMCEDIDPLLSGAVTLACSGGSFVANTSACSIAACETWHFGLGTVGDVTGVVYPLEEIEVGGTGLGDCGSANIEYSGNVSLSCAVGQVTVTDTSECRLTCTWVRSNVTVSIDGSDYLAGPNTERIDHGVTGYGDCSDSVHGYSGLITMSCDNGVLTVEDVNCTPEACTTASELNVTLGDDLGTTTPYLTIAHGGTGEGDCEEANPLYSGSLSMSCFASVLTLISDAGCLRGCNATDSANITLEGYSYEVYPLWLMTSGSDQNTTCPPGFNDTVGSVMLTCDD